MIKNIIFDWSGTLANDLNTTFEATMYVFKKMGVKPMTLEEYRKKFFLPYIDFCDKYLPDFNPEQLRQYFLEGIKTVGSAEVYPGVKEVIKRLHDKGIRIIVMSASTEERIISDAKRYGIFDYFQEIEGDIIDKTEMVLDTIRRNGFNFNETILVGDMPHDIDTAKKAGLISVGIYWGHKPKEILETSEPDYLIGDIKDLEPIIESISK
jgi:HAD superfamily hydrolase (TIGR01549 family)